ncbi:MAG: hypothetical protein EHM58_18740 [Ignavibacteriae bacterium]|nr:MAG: hypothetical protein EHM58_18740 [Ignavibacteriota bacterium]
MGHKRNAFLPKSKRWRDIVFQISNYSIENNNISLIADNILENVKDRFKLIENDKGVNTTFKFLLLLSYSTRTQNPHNFLKENGIELSDNLTPLQITKSLRIWIDEKVDSKEYASFAKSAAIDAISYWYQKNEYSQSNLFEAKQNQFNVWEKASNGTGFCDLSRKYFSKFIEKYLKYFLEREASSNSSSVSERESLNKNLEKYVENISQHSFETSKITQSYTAGWYNKYVIKEFPSDKKIKEFISIAFNKLRAEFEREQKNG